MMGMSRGAPVAPGGLAGRFRAQQAARQAQPAPRFMGRGAPPPRARMAQQQAMAQQMRGGANPRTPPNPTGNRAPMRPTMGPGGRRFYR